MTFKITRGNETVFEDIPFPDDPSPTRALDYCFRLDRLAACSDKKLRNAAVEVQGLQSELWQLMRLNHDYGATRRHRDAAKTRMVAGIVARTAAQFVIEGSRPDPDQIETRDGYGHRYYMNGPEKPADPELVARADAAYNAAVEQMKQWQNQIEETSQRVQRVFAHRSDRLAEVWRNVLIPKFRSAATPSKRPLFRAQMIPAPDGTGNDFATIQNVSGRDLHHVAVEFQADDGHGAEHFWYGYVAVLTPDDTIHVSAHGSKCVADPSVRFEATACMFCDEGSNDHLRLEPRAALTDPKFIAFYKERCDAARAAITAAESFVDQVTKTMRTLYKAPHNPIPARARLQSVVKKGHSYQAQVKRGDKPGQVILYLDNLDTTGSMTRATVQWKWPEKTVAETLLGRIVEDVDRGCVLGFVGLIPPNLQGELDSKHQRLERARSSQQYGRGVRAEHKWLAEKGQKLPLGQLGPQMQKLEDELNSKAFLDTVKTRNDAHQKRWQNGEIWLASTPWEIRDLQMPSRGFGSTQSGPISDKDRKTWAEEEELATRSEPAKYVLFVIESGEILLQMPPIPQTHRVGFLTLKDIGKTPPPTTSPGH